MKLLLPFVILFLAWFTYELKKHERTRNQGSTDFWEHEQKSNLTRRKNIDNLDYITVPIDSLPFFEINDSKITDFQRQIRTISEKKILNLTGMSNTDIKSAYGSANLTLLSEYDENYTFLVSTLNKWGTYLLSLGYEKEGITVLEFGIECKTDVSATYYTLANYYAAHQQIEKIAHLIDVASELNSLTKQPILTTLGEIQNSHA